MRCQRLRPIRPQVSCNGLDAVARQHLRSLTRNHRSPTHMKLHYLPERRPKIFRRVLGVLVAAIISAASANAAADGFRAPTGLGVTVASGDQTTLYGLSTYWDSICTCAPLAERG